jgi:hypothetical protein
LLLGLRCIFASCSMLIPFVITLEDGDFESLWTSYEIIELGSMRLLSEGEREFFNDCFNATWPSG